MIRGTIYFGLVFSVGFVLGIARVLLLVPQLGERWAEIAEAPLMLVAILFSARFIVRRFPLFASRELPSFGRSGPAALGLG